MVVVEFVGIYLAGDTAADMRPGYTDAQDTGEHDFDDVGDDVTVVRRQTEDIDDQPDGETEKRRRQEYAQKSQ